MEKQTTDKEVKIKISTLVYSVLVVLVLVVGILSVLAYGTSTEVGSKISAKISKVVPFPAAVVGWRHVVFMKDVEANMASVEKFYQTKNFAAEGLRVDFSTEEGRKRLKIKEREVLDKMVEDQIIEILAKKRGIKVSDADAQKVVGQKLNEFGTAEDVKSDLADSYGWDMDDFKQRVVMPSIYADALAVKVASENLDNSKAKAKINQAQKELMGGKDFAEVVRIYSEGSSKEKGGELGWVNKDQVLPELQNALFAGNVLEKNKIIESQIGFHIVEVENSKKDEGIEQLQLRQVFVSKNTFADWLENEKKNTNVVVPLKDFVWNKVLGAIDFRDQSMRTFESEQRMNVQGDASIML